MAGPGRGSACQAAGWQVQKPRGRGVPGVLQEQEAGQWGEVWRAKGRVLQDEAGGVGGVHREVCRPQERTRLLSYTGWRVVVGSDLLTESP